MEIIVFLLPFITALFLLFVFNKKMVWWEYVVLIVPTILIIVISRLIMVSYNASDIEYLGSYVTRVTYYEPWDEMVLRTKTRTVSNGKGGTTTQTYTVWEREYHSEKYTYIDSETKREHHLSKKEYDVIMKRLNNTKVFRDMKRHYHRIDGDAYDTYWDNSIEHLYEITTPHVYQNKIKADQNNTIFKHIEISKEEASEMGLYEYPPISMKSQNPIIGKNVSDKDIQRIKYINAKYGKEYQFRTYILIYDNADMEISELQKSYWQNGNKNEFIVCLGVQQDSVIWCNPFSWSDAPKLEMLTRDYFITNPKLNIDEYGKFLEEQIPTNWKRKEFEDFNYIKVGLGRWQNITLLIICILLNVGISIFLVKNEFHNENNLDNWN
jgi:hypothetical protein